MNDYIDRKTSKALIVWVFILAIFIVIWATGIILNIKGLDEDSKESSYEDSFSSKVLQDINRFRDRNSLPYFLENESLKDVARLLAKTKDQPDFDPENIYYLYGLEDATGFVGITEGYDENNVKYLVSRWTSLEATKEKIVNPEYMYAGVGCYRNTCYFVAAKTISTIELKENKKRDLIILSMILTGIIGILVFYILDIFKLRSIDNHMDKLFEDI